MQKNEKIYVDTQSTTSWSHCLDYVAMQHITVEACDETQLLISPTREKIREERGQGHIIILEGMYP